MERETVEYRCGDLRCKGHFVYNEIVKEQRPAILVAPAWKGLDKFAKEKADELARNGYVAFAADIYGEGKVVESNEEAKALMEPLYKNRAELRRRIAAAYETLKELPRVDKGNIGAIGFCFGGLTVIELLRDGADIKGAVSFHGVLGNMGASVAHNAEKIHGALLMLHGHDDPMVSDSDISTIQKELTQAGVDWEMDIYGGTSHAFTNPNADDKELGLLYNEKSSGRAWKAMHRFFNEVFSE